MPESKWDKTLSALNQPSKAPAQTPSVLLPVKAPLLHVKRSTPCMEAQTNVAEGGHRCAGAAKLKGGDKTDSSDLVQALLERWLQNPE